MRNIFAKTIITGLIAAALLFLPSCGKDEDKGIRIAEQYGIAYAPLQIMKELKRIGKRLPGVQVTYKQFGGPTPIREAMVAGEIDFGFMGPAPVLVGIDNGMEWKYATGISGNEVALVTDKAGIKTLKDFTKDDRIALLSPGSTQHILLCIAANKVFNDPSYFDNRIVSLSHPDAMDALMSDTEISAHFATPPYLMEELKQGMHVVITGEEIMGGPFTFITGVSQVAFYEKHREYYRAILSSLEEAINYINDNMEEAASLLSGIYGIPEDELIEQMTYNGTIYSMELKGLQKLADEMYHIKMLKTPIKIEDVTIHDEG